MSHKQEFLHEIIKKLIIDAYKFLNYTCKLYSKSFGVARIETLLTWMCFGKGENIFDLLYHHQ